MIDNRYFISRLRDEYDEEYYYLVRAFLSKINDGNFRQFDVVGDKFYVNFCDICDRREFYFDRDRLIRVYDGRVFSFDQEDEITCRSNICSYGVCRDCLEENSLDDLLGDKVDVFNSYLTILKLSNIDYDIEYMSDDGILVIMFCDKLRIDSTGIWYGNLEMDEEYLRYWFEDYISENSREGIECG